MDTEKMVKIILQVSFNFSKNDCTMLERAIISIFFIYTPTPIEGLGNLRGDSVDTLIFLSWGCGKKVYMHFSEGATFNAPQYGGWGQRGADIKWNGPLL